MGSEFSYEDLGTQAVEKFTYRYLRDEPCGELICTVTEQVPTDGESGYRRRLAWLDKEEMPLWKVEFFDRKDFHLKTLTLDKYELHLDRYWRAA